MPPGKSRPDARPSRKNLFRVWLIRSFLLLALLGLMVWLNRTGAVPLPWKHLAPLVGGTLVIHLLLLLRLRIDWPVREPEFFAHLLLDVAFLTALLYLTGGSTNPLVSYFLIPLIISAAVLRPAYTRAMPRSSSASAMARPMPRLAPVTSATLSAILFSDMGSLLLC